MNQVEEHQPPPDPAKLTDSRCGGYVAEYGSHSWELDALEPSVLVGLITETILSLREEARWAEMEERERNEKEILELTSDNWPDVAAFVRDNFPKEDEDDEL